MAHTKAETNHALHIKIHEEVRRTCASLWSCSPATGQEGERIIAQVQQTLTMEKNIFVQTMHREVETRRSSIQGLFRVGIHSLVN